MPATTPQTFCDLLEKSNLLTTDQLTEIRSSLPDAAPVAICDRLVSSGWITRWQARQLLAGRGGFSLKKYKLLEQIGQGGMGAVFKAQQPGLGRIVAIKVMAGEVLKSPQAVARFQREIRSAAALDHPNIVRALDADCMSRTYFLVMEYVSGHDLKSWIKQQGRLPIDWSCQVIRQAAEGLQHAHERGFVHRDIKPANLLVVLDPETQQPTIKILDFGLARFRSETHEGGELTRTGEIMGTPDYIAPEQARSTHQADIRADIFSLGCTLFELLTGQIPFGGVSTMEKLMSRVLSEAPLASKFRPDVPPDLDAIVARMLARDPAQRFQTPGEVVAALLPFSQGSLPVAVAAAPQGPQNTVSQATPATFPSRNDSTLNRFLDQLAFEPTDSIEPSTTLHRSVSKKRVSRTRLWAGLATAGVLVAFLPGVALFSNRNNPRKGNAVSESPVASEPQTIDVLKKIDVHRDYVRGLCRFDGDVLVMPQDAPAIVKLPFTPPEEYDVRIVATPKSNSDTFYIGLVAPGNVCFGIVVDGWGGTIAGIHLIDGQMADRNPSTNRVSVFTQGKPSTVICSVRHDGIRVVADGRPIIEWSDYIRVSEGWREFVSESVPFLGVWQAEFAISEITLTRIESSSDGPAEEVAGKGRKKNKSIAARASEQSRVGNWILRNQGGFAIPVAGGERWIGSLADWPSETFRIIAVNLNSTSVTDESVEMLAPLTGLQRLSLDSSSVTDSALLQLKHWPELIDLHLSGTHVTGAGFAELRHVPRLTGLFLLGLKLDPGALKHLENLTHLKLLDLAGSNISDRDFQHLEPLPELNSLNFNGNSLTGAGMGRLKSFPLLTELYVDSGQLDDQGLDTLCDVSQLRRLSFVGTEVSDAGLRHLARLPDLVYVGLGGETITNTGLRQLAAVKKLESLYVMGGRFDGSGFEALGELPNFRELQLTCDEVDGAGLKAIGQLQSIHSLQIFSTRVVDEDLMHLANLKNCRYLKLGCASITDSGVGKLQEALPECQISR